MNDERHLLGPAGSFGAVSQDYGATPDSVERPSQEGPSSGPRYSDGPTIGSGGFGVVRSVHDHWLGRDVALKELHAAGPEQEARLHREAKLTAELDHPGIVPIYDVGRTAEGRLYYTMRLVIGGTLGHRIARADTDADRLELVPLVRDAARAVVASSGGRRLAHRDDDGRSAPRLVDPRRALLRGPARIDGRHHAPHTLASGGRADLAHRGDHHGRSCSRRPRRGRNGRAFARGRPRSLRRAFGLDGAQLRERPRGVAANERTPRASASNAAGDRRALGLERRIGVRSWRRRRFHGPRRQRARRRRALGDGWHGRHQVTRARTGWAARRSRPHGSARGGGLRHGLRRPAGAPAVSVESAPRRVAGARAHLGDRVRRAVARLATRWDRGGERPAPRDVARRARHCGRARRSVPRHPRRGASPRWRHAPSDLHRDAPRRVRDRRGPRRRLLVARAVRHHGLRRRRRDTPNPPVGPLPGRRPRRLDDDGLGGRRPARCRAARWPAPPLGHGVR
ncbi:MAG: protein kinase [Myxococcales bacterium]|nr:protein kinase [Myxococcales bacterium]